MRRECDLVMKGGVTSGVVYPPAIYAISRSFDLRSIGGTSAGAIAAALAAAAQYRRSSDGVTPEAGYEALDAIPAWLGRDGNLLRLFVPNRETRHLFETISALAAKGQSWPERARTLCTAYGVPALLGGIPGLLHALAANSIENPALRALNRAASVGGFVAGAVAGAGLALALDARQRIPANQYGLATGLGDAAGDGLCAWLAEQTESIAGLPVGKTPLTFGMLWNPAGGAGPNGLEDPVKDPRINLTMMTTSVVEGRPYVFPMRTNRYLFRPSEMKRFFPEHVVAWMIARARTVEYKGKGKGKRKPVRSYRIDGEQLVPLPAIGDLPVLVATRMSLAFPVLLSAVPLYRVEYGDEAASEPRRVLFCDGGITSNFPIAMFDAPLPRHPTLAMNLGTFPAGAGDDAPDVVMATDNRPSAIYPPNDVTGLSSFAGAILSTMQNWNDASLARLPGFRDRIVTVRLRRGEGGLNLSMSPATVAGLVDRGRRAGAMLVERFGAPSTLAPFQADAPMSWENHRWVRYRTVISELRDLLGRYNKAWRHPAGGDVPFADLVLAEAEGTIPHHAYRLPKSKELREKIRALSHELADLGAALAAQEAFAYKTPNPQAALVTRAQLDRA